jgi:hypothetical protein
LIQKTFKPGKTRALGGLPNVWNWRSHPRRIW